jgi:signal transduction histidine kinase
MGWDIQVESTEGEGTVVTLLVPLAAGVLPEGA